MSIDVLTSNDITVFTPIGRLDSNNNGEAESIMIGRIDGGASRVVIDFSRLDYISSAGLRVILVAAKRLRETDGKLAVCNMKDHIREIFALSGFLSILTVCDSLEEAERAVGA